MSNRDFIDIRILLAIAVSALLVFCFPLCVHAEESVDSDSTESETDTSQNERLNALEVRLEEMGYQINEIEMSIESIYEELELTEEQRLAIGQQLELLIIGVSQLCDDSLSFMEKYDLAVAESSSMQINANTSLNEIKSSLDVLNENTVSGNALITAFGDNIQTDMQNISEASITEFNETLHSTNTLLSYLFVLILILLVLMISYGVGAIIQNIIKRSVL